MSEQRSTLWEKGRFRFRAFEKDQEGKGDDVVIGFTEDHGDESFVTIRDEDHALARRLLHRFVCDQAREMHQRCDEIESATAKIAAVVHIGSEMHADGMYRPDGPIESLIEFCSSEKPTNGHDSIDALLPDNVEDAPDSWRDCGEFFDDLWAMRRRFGFAIEVHTPVLRDIRPDGCTYSWGYSRTTWVYGDTFDQAWDAAIDWARKEGQRQRDEALSESAGGES